MKTQLGNHKREIEREFNIVEGSNLYEIEMRAEEHLLKMSVQGVKLNVTSLNKRLEELSAELVMEQKEIENLTEGTIISPNSSAQVALYYSRKGITFPVTLKGNPQVNQETLSDLTDELAPKLISYRKKLSACSQLKSVSKVIDSEGRVHPTYLSTKCATGRIYTENPNIQGWGSDLKNLISPDEGYSLIVADYKAQELRILASLSGCKKLLDAFANGIDVHSLTYSVMTNTPIEQVTAEQRNIGKVLNFATIYGQTPEGLARDLKVSVERARVLQEDYFDTYPEIRTWLNKTIFETKQKGYIQTPWGRQRKISFDDVSKAERQAVNTPVQGAGADIIKSVLSRTLTDSDSIRVLTTIHDSIVIEYKSDLSREHVESWLRKIMEIDFNGVKMEVDFK